MPSSITSPPGPLTCQGMVHIHSAPKAFRAHLEWGVGRVLGHSVGFEWSAQPVSRGALRADFHWVGPEDAGAAITSALLEWPQVRFEVTSARLHCGDGDRWMHTPSHGIFHAHTDALGNIVIPEDRIRSALADTLGDPHALAQLLDEILGTRWDEELELFRGAGEDSTVVWLHDAG